jgi:hypothetical protein
MTTSTATRTAIAGLAFASALTLGMTADTWNPYTRALDAQAATTHKAPYPEGPILLGGYWEPVVPGLADSMAEGGAPDATTRDWESCKAHLDYAWSWVVCPDGYEEHWENW